MAIANVQETQCTEFAEHVYTGQRADSVSDFTQYLQSRIESGLAQFENGEYMSFDEFEAKFRKAYLANSLNEKV